jgi:hypothetical protein
MGTCKVHWSLWRNGVVALLCLLLAVGSALALSAPSPHDRHMALFGLLFFGVPALMFICRTVDRRPVLVVDAQGVTMPSYGLVPWGAIDRVGLAPDQAVLIFPKQPDAWRSRVPFLHALMWRVFRKGRCLSVSLQNVDTLTPPIYEAVKAYFPVESTGNGLIVLKPEEPAHSLP